MLKNIVGIFVLAGGLIYFLLPWSPQGNNTAAQPAATVNQNVDTALAPSPETLRLTTPFAAADGSEIGHPVTSSIQPPTPAQITQNDALHSAFVLLNGAKDSYEEFMQNPTGSNREVLLGASNLLRTCAAIPSGETEYIEWSLAELPHNRAEADAFYNLCRGVGTSATEFEHLEQALSPLLDAGDTDAVKQYVDWVALQGEYFEREKAQSTISAILQENNRFRLATGLQLNARLNRDNPVELNVSESVLLHIANLHGALNADLANFMRLRVAQGLSELTPSQYNETVTRIEQLKTRYQKIYTEES